jgi:hypothetical protein
MQTTGLRLCRVENEQTSAIHQPRTHIFEIGRLTILGTAVIVNVWSFCPGRLNVCLASCHQLYDQLDLERDEQLTLAPSL